MLFVINIHIRVSAIADSVQLTCYLGVSVKTQISPIIICCFVSAQNNSKIPSFHLLKFLLSTSSCALYTSESNFFFFINTLKRNCCWVLLLWLSLFYSDTEFKIKIDFIIYSQDLIHPHCDIIFDDDSCWQIVWKARGHLFDHKMP